MPESDSTAIDIAIEPDATMVDYNPHVTVGVGPRELLDEMVAAPFDEFVFSPSGLSIYQLGNFGTAASKLSGWTITPA